MLLEKKDSEGSNYLVDAFWAFLVLLLVQHWFPEAIPFKIFEFWKSEQPIWEGIKASWPIFAWAVGTSLLVSILTRNHWKVNKYAERLLVGGFITSVFAGVMEEIAFRWVFFLNAIWLIQLLNWLFFGFAGFGISEWFYLSLLTPVADFATLGLMHDILYHPLGWFVGAAVIGANAKFRNGHKYLGIIGLINSWVIGMFLFWLMFNYGLVVCIIVHFLYDLFIHVVCYFDAAYERSRGGDKEIDMDYIRAQIFKRFETQRSRRRQN